MNKKRISITFMFVTIATIAAFQAFWLRKNYQEEKKIFTIHSNFLFKETIFKLQTAKLHLDTMHIRIQDKAGVIGIKHVLENKITEERLIRDSFKTPSMDRAFIISMKENVGHDGSDSVQHVYYRNTAKGPTGKVFDFLAGVDSLQDPITVKEIADRYRAALAREGVHIPFYITEKPVTRLQGPFPFDTRDNQVTIGFSRPVLYQLDLGNLFWFMARRVGPQALFSLVLVGCTILSFLLLYRNWQQQRKLTQLKNDFISNITHELKTPIATVSVAVEALRNFNALQDPKKTQEYLDISANELQRLSLLVDKVLKLSLFERQEIELKNDRFDLKGLVEEVMASMRLQFEKYRAQLTMQTHGADFHVSADKLHITSVIFNLLDNALKYSRHNPSIQIDLEASPDQLVLAVTDNGMGIPPAYKDRIFEKFFRVPSGDRHNVKGYGLGLSYVYYVLQRQGGEISVDSQEGIGSRFTVKLPRNDV